MEEGGVGWAVEATGDGDEAWKGDLLSAGDDRQHRNVPGRERKDNLLTTMKQLRRY